MLLRSPVGALAAALSLASSVVADKNTAAPSPATTFAECQKYTSNPLEGCPKGTIYVALNDTRADFHSIQSAILSIPNNSVPYYILIGAGTYYEQLNVTRSGPLYLFGQSNLPSKHINYASSVSYNHTVQNDVQIYYNSANVGGDLFTDNVYTGVLTIGPTLNATLTGSGTTGFAVPDGTPFGTVDFRAYNIDFRNEYAPYSDGPAHALGVSRANAGFYSCGFYSWQDTVCFAALFTRTFARYFSSY
jgi:pectin methylesterase-like acyl-CoA thioesterase